MTNAGNDKYQSHLEEGLAEIDFKSLGRILSHLVASIFKTMALMTMGKPQLAVRITPTLMSELNGYAQKTGTSKTDVVVSAIAKK